MNLKKLFNDDNAVSPVIGVILMVAITVILAAVTATFVLGLGEQVSDSAPNASFDFDYDRGNSGAELTHSGGPNIATSQLDVTTTNSSNSVGAWSSDPVSAGNSITVWNLGGGERISVVWENEEGSESSTLQRFDVPE